MNDSRIGILGGTFDPIHYGHLAIAEEVRVTLHLSRVLIIPAGEQPLKAGRSVASPSHRLTMTQLACADNPHFEVSNIEIERAGPSYTIITLEQLRARYAGDFHLILGADALSDLPRWREARRVLTLTRLMGVARPGASLDLTRLAQAVPGVLDHLTIIDGPRLDISSTDLRQRIATGKPVRYQMPDSVIAYIAEHGLYR